MPVDSLKLYFSKFGDIEESTVMMDNKTGRSRGFGYVKFKNDESVDWVLRQKPHLIDLKEVDPKRCNVNMKGKVEIKAMKPPNTQKPEYQTSPNVTTAVQGNGRPVRGQKKQYGPPQSNGSCKFFT
ncbi:unnamed protein product [Trichobilharzia regenti]|nr:unnamed protein product [Trichobilharzia regenti]